MDRRSIGDQSHVNVEKATLCQNVIEILSSDDEEKEEEKERNCCVTIKDYSATSTSTCNDNIISKEAPDNTKRPSTTHESTDSTDSTESKERRKKVITYQNSAYVQHLAEICHDILHDERWKTIEDKKRLFQWESGDDLSVIHAFDRLYIPMDGMNSNDNNVIRSKSNEEEESDSPNCEQSARCLHLYSRLFHRKGPWYSLPDIFIRYYHRDYIRRKLYKNNSCNDHPGIDYDMNHNESTNNDDADPSAQKEVIITWSWIEECLLYCFNDIHCLIRNGFFRSFKSEEECGTIIGSNDSICTMKEKENILRKLGGKPKVKQSFHNTSFDENTPHSSKKRRKRMKLYRENEILKQMKSQNTIFAFAHSRTRSVLPVEKHVSSILLESFAQKLSAEVNKSLYKQGLKTNQKSINEIIKLIKETWKKVSSLNVLPIGFRLREAPLVSLRRCARIYLIAGNGPGNMRFDGSNAWLTIYERTAVDDTSLKELHDSRSFASDVCTIPDPPDACQWHKVDFIGLNYRLGLVSCHFMNNYSRLPSSRMSKYHNDAISNVNVEVNIFKDIQSFHIWELCIEFRNMIDYLIQWNNLVLYTYRKKNSSDKNERSSMPVNACPMHNNFDFLSTVGRRKIIDKFLSYLNGSRCSETIHESVETAISSISDKQGNEDEDSFITDAERIVFVCGLICQHILLFSLEGMLSKEMMYLINRPWLRHLCWQSCMSYLIWDCVEITEKRGYHQIAIGMLETIFHGSKIRDHTSRQQKTIKDGYMQVLLSRRVRGKVYDRIALDEKHVMRKNKNEQKNTKKIKHQEKQLKSQYEERISYLFRELATASAVPFRYVNLCYLIYEAQNCN